MKKLAITAITKNSQEISAAKEIQMEENVANQGEVVSTTTSMKGQVTYRNYVLNDSSALKKKKRNETRKEAFNLGTEARDGSNMVIQMKTTFFEHVKSKFIEDMLKHKDIVKVENALGSKVATENSGEAFVEYSLDLTFRMQDNLYVTKMTAYTTTCRVMFQPVGDARPMLANKSIPRYFTDVFFLPWCEAALAKNEYDEKEIMDAINNEIKRLDTLKLRKGGHRGRVSSAPTADMKCVSRICKYTGLDSSNKSAVGVCRRCGGYEHFECSKTKKEDRDDILAGKQEYFCSLCFMNNPSMVAFNAKKSITMNFQPDSTLQVTAKTKATPIPGPIVPIIKFACTYCDIVSETQERLDVHTKDNHFYPCDVCKKSFITETDMKAHRACEHKTAELECQLCEKLFTQISDLEEHKVEVHSGTISTCEVCKVNFKSEEELKNHEKSCHPTECPLCTLSFTDYETAAKHIKNDHAPKCTKCDKSFATKEELEKHINDHHSAQNSSMCRLCEIKFNTNEDLNVHLIQEHICTICKATVNNKIEMETHIQTMHMIECSKCNVRFQDENKLEEHMKDEHSVQCPICTKTFEDKITLTDHIQTEHNFVCNECGKSFLLETELEGHIERAHTHSCTICSVSFETKESLEAHTKESHDFLCPFCNKQLRDSTALKEHITNTHTFECNMCNFEGATVGIMENHVIEKHFSPDENGQFQCDECEHKCNTRKELKEHYQAEHGLTGDKYEDDNSAQNQRNLEEELRLLKNHFQRLESLFKETSEELEKVKTDYEAKLTEANDKFRTVKAENEELKEKVDVLFKLGRSYINRKEKNTDEIMKEQHKSADKIECVETVLIDQEDDISDLQEWTKHKLRGFKRSNPTAPPTQKQKDDPTSNKKKSPPTSKATSLQAPVPPAPAPATKPAADLYKGRYCHYFVNKGSCTFEERTGQKCKYEHTQAPMCKSGINCTRFKCMYSHPKHPAIQNHTRSNFLGQVWNPFPLMNPWMSPPQSPWNFPSPWIQGKQNTRN